MFVHSLLTDIFFVFFLLTKTAQLNAGAYQLWIHIAPHQYFLVEQVLVRCR